jgi:hypothetical protein
MPGLLGGSHCLAEVDQRCDVVRAISPCDERLVACDHQLVAVLHCNRPGYVAARLGEAKRPAKLPAQHRLQILVAQPASCSADRPRPTEKYRAGQDTKVGASQRLLHHEQLQLRRRCTSDSFWLAHLVQTEFCRALCSPGPQCARTARIGDHHSLPAAELLGDEGLERRLFLE